MNYEEIKDVSYGYAYRSDVDTLSMFDNFLRVTESRINKHITTSGSSKRAKISTVEGKSYYALPADFNGMRDIEVGNQNSDPNNRISLEYLPPHLMNSVGKKNSTKSYYTIVGNQVQIYPITSNRELEIIYYSKLSPLTVTDNENWLSISDPDVYIFGLLVEINAFVKDVEAVAIWEQRFTASMDNLVTIDQRTRWSGTPLETTLG